MSDWYTGAIYITPPLTWGEIQNGPKIRDVRLRLVNDITDTDAGRTTITTADAIVPAGDEACSGRWVEDDIQAIVDHYVGHEFSGHIQCDYDAGVVGPDEPNRDRYVVRDGRVETVAPRLVWPGETDALLADARALALLCRDVLKQMPVGMDEFIGLESSELPGWFVGYDNGRELSGLAMEGGA